jgi:hypothetical protein
MPFDIAHIGEPGTQGFEPATDVEMCMRDATKEFLLA